jgi:hypothetical protein
MSTVNQITSKQLWDISLAGSGPGMAGQKIVPTALNPTAVQYSPTSNVPPVSGMPTAPPVEQYVPLAFVGDSGTPSFTIDLTAVEDVEGFPYDGTGKKVREIRIQADKDNSAAAAVDPGDSDPYELFGSSGIEVQPGGLVLMRFGDGLTAITDPASGTGATTLKVTLSHGDVLTVELLIG